MVALGTPAHNFTLVDTVSAKPVSLEVVKSDVATVIMFICNHCPFVKHVQQQLVYLANDYIPRGIRFVAISSNDAEKYPDDGPEHMAEVAKENGYPFPYLYDETQEVAKAYEAACTPDFYIYDRDMKLAYRGQLDDSRPGNDIPVTGKDIRNALDQLIAGQPVSADQRPSLGCNIKWKE
nr:thioredoxin family protein [Paenibacillus alkalitolerans]